MYESNHRLKPCRPKTEGVDDEMQEKERAKDESGDGEIMAWTYMAAAPAAAFLFRLGEIQRQQITGRNGLRLPQMATAAAMTAMARRIFPGPIHDMADFLPQAQMGRGVPVCCDCTTVAPI